MWFIDEYRGWAVGTLGAILHTRDGGRSWRVQREGGSRAALLAVFGEERRVPLEIVADQGGNAAFLTVAETLGRREQQLATAKSGQCTAPRRTHAAIVAAGGSAADAAWRFPLPVMSLLPSADAILARWNAANDGQAAQRLEEHLVKRIRQWRPEVIVTDDLSPRGDDSLAHLTNQITLAAVSKAGDETAYPELASDLGLAAWRVKKVLALLPQEKQGVVNFAPSACAERLGRSVAEQAELGRGLLLREVATSPRNIGLALLVDRLPQDSGKRDIMSGIVLAPGGEARRQLADPPAGDLKRLADTAQKRHNVEQLLSRIDATNAVGAGWLGQVKDLTEGLGSRTAGEILWQLGRKYQQSGKLREAAEAMELLLSRHPQHPVADAAALWLVQYYASGEVAWRLRKETRFEVQLATPAVAETGNTRPTGEVRIASNIRPVGFVGVSTSGTAAPQLHPAEWAGQALRVAKQIEQTRPTLYADPALRFALAAAARLAGQPRSAERWFQSLAGNGTGSVWSQNAAAEQWLFRPNENAPKKVCSVVTALQKPRLDGRLDDAAWQIAKPVSLTSAAPGQGDSPAVVAILHDEEFVYLAISCPKVVGADYSASIATRVPDTDLSRQDRVTVLLDIDRDYATYWSLTVDHRGWPAEACIGDATWNPEWFIAAGGDDEFWTVEAAIPLAELASSKPKVRDVWAVGLQRVVPSAGFQSFSSPASMEESPEAMGLWVFE
jgi:hypothetical protein